MVMLCFKNGSVTRERVRDQCAGSSWPAFNDCLESTPAGNDGCLGFYFDQPEIVPPANAGFHRFDSGGKRVAAFEPAQEVRAVVESQFLSMRAHANSLGINDFRRIIVTGGASCNAAILQVRCHPLIVSKVYNNINERRSQSSQKQS
jgi:xylulokinase